MEELVAAWDEVQTPWKCSTINREFWEQRSIRVFHLVFGHERRALVGEHRTSGHRTESGVH